MFNGKTFLAVIPARGGSKRLPRKNILPLAGKPLIAWSIKAARKSKYIDKIVVSSDDDEILAIAQENSVEVIKRPKKLASDTATTFDALKHTVENYSGYDYIVLLQATSPLRESDDIDNAIELLKEKNADAIVSVCKMEHSPLWSNKLPFDGSMQNFLKEEVLNQRSQELEEYYRLNGAIYLARTDKFLEEKSFFLNENIYAYIMKQNRSIDIDTEEDFEMAKCILSQNL